MSDPRWTNETEELVARVLSVGAYDTSDVVNQAVYRIGARAILAAQANAGLLVQPGVVVREEWFIDRGGWSYPLTAEEARVRLTDGQPGIKRQTTHTAPPVVVTGSPS